MNLIKVRLNLSKSRRQVNQLPANFIPGESSKVFDSRIYIRDFRLPITKGERFKKAKSPYNDKSYLGLWSGKDIKSHLNNGSPWSPILDPHNPNHAALVSIAHRWLLQQFYLYSFVVHFFFFMSLLCDPSYFLTPTLDGHCPLNICTSIPKTLAAPACNHFLFIPQSSIFICSSPAPAHTAGGWHWL